MLVCMIYQSNTHKIPFYKTLASSNPKFGKYRNQNLKFTYAKACVKHHSVA